jgi:hypothetical protein
VSAARLTAARQSAIVRETGRVPFDLAASTCSVATLVRLAADDHVLLVETHTSRSMDGPVRCCFDELAASVLWRYASVACPLQYADFAIWQREQLAGARSTS